MISAGLAKLREWRKQHMTRTVIYRRGAQSVSLAATRGRSQQTRDAEGFPLRIESAEFIIDPLDLVLGIASTLPKRGDTIEDEGVVFEVLADPGLDCWRYCDSERKSIRVHVKQVGA